MTDQPEPHSGGPLARPDSLLAGRRLYPFEIAKVCHDAGWRDERLIDAVCTVLGESLGYTEATNDNPDGSTDRGIWQINSRWVDQGFITIEDCFKPVPATALAYRIYKGRDYRFTAWVAYTSGAYQAHRPAATRGVANMWRHDYGIRFLIEG